MELPELTKAPLLNVDMTPNEGLPLRILRAYRENCDSRWASTTDGYNESNPLFVAMNEMQDKRAEILDRAITKLVS